MKDEGLFGRGGKAAKGGKAEGEGGERRRREKAERVVAVIQQHTQREKEGKFIENGQIVILKAGKKFNAAGAQIK